MTSQCCCHWMVLSFRMKVTCNSALDFLSFLSTKMEVVPPPNRLSILTSPSPFSNFVFYFCMYVYMCAYIYVCVPEVDVDVYFSLSFLPYLGGMIPY